MDRERDDSLIRALEKAVGDCFVIMSGAGRFWSGTEWVEDWREARQFTAPPLRDPWLACHQASESLEQATGLYCAVAFVPRRNVNAPRRGARSKRESGVGRQEE